MEEEGANAYARMVLEVLQRRKPRALNQDELMSGTNLSAAEILQGITVLSKECKITKHSHTQTNDLYIGLASPQEQETLQLESRCSTPNEKRVIRQVYESGNQGITQRQLAAGTNIESREVRKIVTALAKVGLIKSQKGVKAKNLNFYMIATVVPDKAKFGGFFHDAESLQLKTNVVADLQRAVQMILTKSPHETATMDQMYNLLPQVLSGSVVPEDGMGGSLIEQGDIDKLVELLELDGVVKLVEKQDVRLVKLEKVKRRGDTGYTSTPCCRCPVVSDCSDTGGISPLKCKYLTEWLEF